MPVSFIYVFTRARKVSQQGRLHDLITKTVKLKLKDGYLSFQKKINIFKGVYCQKHSVILPMSE